MRTIFFVVIFAAALSATAMTTPVQQLPASSTAGPISYDSTSGVCRTIRFSTSSGEIQVLVCDKGDHYELYRQSAPSGLTFKACTGGGSVDQISGFSSFTSTTLGPGCGQTTVTSLVDPNSAGFANKTRAQNHADLLDIWWSPSKNIVQTFTCGTQTCAWVPWYGSGTSCYLSDLHRLDDCGGSGTASLSDNCMVTDELSQVMLATAQGANETRMVQLLNTLQLIASGSNGGNYETLPAWRARRTNNSVNVSSSGPERDVASDADARAILALYIAANSSYFSSTTRNTFRNYANTMAADFLEHDFRNEPRTGRNGAQVTYWLAGGGNTATGGLGSNNFSFAGYYGDVVIALLAAYKATGMTNYRTAAQNTVDVYLLASEYNGSFRVPPKAFKWDTGLTPPKPVCTDNCDGRWDYYDAPRATSVCKACYFANLAGVTLPADLATYCTGWMNAGGIHAYDYVVKYTWAGVPDANFDDAPYQNGLALSLNFSNNTSDLTTRLDRVGSKWDGVSEFYGQQCLGVYGNAFFLVNLGSAIGRDLPAFMNP